MDTAHSYRWINCLLPFTLRMKDEDDDDDDDAMLLNIC